MGEEHWPEEIRLTEAGRKLVVVFAGETMALPAEYLRVESPSAEVQGHGPDEKRIIGGKRWIAIRAVEPVGHYAVRLVFDDGHDSGLFTWDYLYRLGAEQEGRWAAYLAALTERGLSREG